MQGSRAKNSWKVVIAVAIFAACAESPTEPKETDEASFAIGGTSSFVTTGGAEVTFLVDFFTDRISFNAKGSPASGEFNWQGKVFGENVHLHGHILCYSIAANRARVGGLVDDSDVPALVGQEAVWMVEDNGEGSGFIPDRTAPIVTGGEGTAAVYCNAPPGVPDPDMYPIETGNVQVHY